MWPIYKPMTTDLLFCSVGLIMDTLGTSVLFRGCSFFGGRNVWTIIYRQGVNSVSIVGRLSTLQSVPLSEVCNLEQ